MSRSFRSLLLGSVTGTACTIALVAPCPAAAQCATSGSTVTCSGATTDTQAQQAVNAATPPNLTLTVNQGAVIASSSRTITVGNSGFPVFVPPNQFITPPSFSAVTFNNAGRIGTSPSLTTDVYFAGGNTFAGLNSGVVNGSLVIGGAPFTFTGSNNALSGAGTLSNTGTVTGTVSLTGRGDQTYTGAGAIQGGQFPFSGQSGLTVASLVSTTTYEANNRQTTTVAGGTGSATVDGVLRSTGTTPVFLSVSASGVTGANATINGTTGGVSVSALFANTTSQYSSSNTGSNFSFSNNNTSQAVGGAATLTVGANGTINGAASVTGLTSATATVNGAIAAPTSQFSDRGLRVTANATDTNYAQSQTQSFSPAFSVSSFQSSSNSTSRGGSANVTIGAGGSVAGGVSVTGGATANAVVNGAIGGASFPNGLTVAAGATDTTSNSTSRSDGFGGFSNSSGSSTQRGGAASATIGTSGSVAGSVQVTGITSATATVAGTIGTVQNTTGLSVVAQGADTTSSSSSSSSNATGSTSTSTSTDTRTSRAGAASAVVTSSARIAGVVNVSGGTSATATIDGAVGSASNPFGGVFVYAGGSDGTSTTTTIYPRGGFGTQTQESSGAARGGAASVTVGATGSVIGSVQASSNRGAATATLAGRAGVANPQGYSPGSSLLAISTGSDMRSTSISAPSRNGYSNSSTVAGGQATATVTGSGIMSGDVGATGDAGATIFNAGMVSGQLRATAGAANTTNSSDSTASSTATNAVTTTTQVSTSSNTRTPVAADALVTNNGSAGSVSATATGNVAFRNDGTVVGGVVLSATTAATTQTQSNQTVTTSTPAAGGGATVVTTSTGTSAATSQSVGGNVVATYNGMIGTNPTNPNQAQQTAVTQTANGSSTASLAGVMFANFTGSTGGATTNGTSSTVTTTTTQPSTGAGVSAATQTTVTSTRNSTTITGGASSVTVAGAVRNNGAGTGNVTVRAATGPATATINGGLVEGNLIVSAGQGRNTTSSVDQTSTSTRAASTGFFSPLVLQSSNATSTDTARLAGGTATAALTNARVGRVAVSGVGTGAASAAATVTVDAGTTVGSLSVTSGGLDTRTDRTETFAIGVRTVTTTRADTVSALSGDARADVAGRADSISTSATGGSATANLTGLSTGAVTVLAGGGDRTTTTVATSAPILVAPGFTTDSQTGQTRNETTTARGGVATLAINSSAANAIGGPVLVNGRSGSVLTIASGSRVLTNNGGNIEVGGNAENTVSSETSSFTNGNLTSRTTVLSSTPVTGAASLTNAGTVGTATAYVSAPVLVTVSSVGGAALNNAGSLFGEVVVSAAGTQRTTITVFTPGNDTTPQRSIATTSATAIGSAANLTNAGVISGPVRVVAATGTVANTGVLRDVVRLGGSVNTLGSTTTTTTSLTGTGVTTTSATGSATPPATLFAQSYALNQNGLLLGGLRVLGATTNDPATGTAVRTSTVTAAVNLNQGSATLGDVTGETNAAGRLTSTTVNLMGDGFLGAAPGLQPTQPTAGRLAFLNAPDYSRFVALDPALANVALNSGSRITGVDSVQKTGGGTFTIVGAPLLRGAAGAQTTYTVDAPLLRVSGGELQLGVAGVDPVTGQGVFGVRGALQNDASLVLGRRVTDGTLTAVQGLTLSVTGDAAQSATGTLVLSARLQPAVLATPVLVSSPSFLSVDGNLALAGTVQVTAPGGLYLAGRGPDVASVGGTFTNTAAVSAFASPFVTFTLSPRSEGGRTIVSLDTARVAYATVATNGNARAAAGALQAALPFAAASGTRTDLANVLIALDTQLGAGGAARSFDELGQASFYGSLAAISTTKPFGEAADALMRARLHEDRPLNLALRMGGNFARTRGDAGTGARDLLANSLGFSVGLGATKDGFDFGVGGGRGWTDANAGLGRARAETWLLGGWAAGKIGPLSLAAQAVGGWSSWTATRAQPTFARFASTDFHSREIRVSGRAALDLTLSDTVALSPFAAVEWRTWRFGRFAEANAGALGVSTQRTASDVVSPEFGARVSGTTGFLHAFIEGSYVLQPNIDTQRSFVLNGAPVAFTTQGVLPRDFAKFGGGLDAEFGRGAVFLRGDVSTGGGNRVGAVRGGVAVRF